MNTQPRQVMLVDDEPKLLSALRRRLSADFDLVTFENGLEALEYLRTDHNVAVIVADMQMPIINGIDLLVEVQKCAPQVRRLMLTGNSDQQTVIDAINLGNVMRFVRKPCDASDLKTIINQALEDFEFQHEELSFSQTAEQTPDSGKAAFLSVISEELRTPLNQIIGMAEVLAKENSRMEHGQLTSSLQQIGQSGDYLLSLVDRILQFTKLQSENPSDWESGTFDIIGLIRQAMKKLDAAAAEKSVSMSFETIPQYSEVIGVETEIALAMHELISNAIKFNNYGGHVSILIRASDDLVAIRISNTGKVIPIEIKDRLMHPFRQADSSLTREHGGLGLGLALVSTITQKNDLYFDLHEARSGGTSATIVFKKPAALKNPGAQLADMVLKAS